MILTISLSFTENLAKAVQEFKTAHSKEPDYIIVYVQRYSDYVNTLDEEKRNELKRSRPAYMGIPLILSANVAPNEIIPVGK